MKTSKKLNELYQQIYDLDDNNKTLTKKVISVSECPDVKYMNWLDGVRLAERAAKQKQSIYKLECSDGGNWCTDYRAYFIGDVDSISKILNKILSKVKRKNENI